MFSQFEQATDPMQKSFAAFGLMHLHGDAISMAPVVDRFGIKLTNVAEYAHGVLARHRRPVTASGSNPELDGNTQEVASPRSVPY
jgi:hypothetical protein